MHCISGIVWLSATVLAQAWASDVPDFSHYPQTEALRFVVGSQTNCGAQLARSNLLVISGFLGSDRVVLNYGVTQDGHESDCRMVCEWAVQASHSKELSADSLKSLRTAIGELPVHSELPPIDRLVIVSFRDGTNWVTRSYDKQLPPEALRTIYGIIGERFETKDKTKKVGF